MVAHRASPNLHFRPFYSHQCSSHIETQLPADVQSRVVAVAVFGDPLRLTGDALPLDDQKNVVAFCNTGDPVCQNGGNALAHIRYGTDGSVTKAAEFIAAKFKA